ncbi:MAG: rod shape-determining protein MreD [Ruegeria sp.]
MGKATSQTWFKRGLFLLIAVLILFLHLLPLDTQPDRWPFPDLLIAMTFAWVLRRPELVPTLSVALVMLVADLLLQRPPGLLAALVVGGTAYLRSAAPGMRDIGFVGEWISVGAVMSLIFVANRTVLSIVSVQQVALGPALFQLVLTITVYPLMVLATQALFGVRRVSASDPEALGGRA